MKYIFEDPARQAQLKIILESWIGTPFRHGCGVKGLGCDCIHLVAGVLQEMEILPVRRNLVPKYSKDWHLHNTQELLADGIRRELSVEDTPLSSLMNGDIVLSHYGKAASHAAIYFDGYVYQAINDIGVCKIHISDRLLRRQMRYGLRILA